MDVLAWILENVNSHSLCTGNDGGELEGRMKGQGPIKTKRNEA